MRTLPIVLGLVVSLAPVPATAATVGAWDATFGCAGKTVTRCDGFNFDSDGFQGLTSQPDGKLVAVGSVNDILTSGEIKLVLARFLQDGSLDPTFGTGGLVFETASPLYFRGETVAVQTDGKIVAAGEAWDGTGTSEVWIVRTDATGVLDPGFAGDGIAQLAIVDPAQVGSITIDGSGNVIVVGSTQHLGASSALVARLLPDGTPDATFGTNGIFTFGAGTAEAWGFALALRPDGEMVVVGQGGSPVTTESLVALVGTAGTLDTSFGGGDGFVLTGAGPDPGSGAWSVALQLDGSILTAGSAAAGTQGTEFQVARYDPTGTLNPSFGSGGIVDVGTSTSAWGVGVAPLADGRIYVWGLTDVPNKPWQGMATVARLNSDGSFDPTFGNGGFMRTVMRDSMTVDDGILDPAGRIVLAVHGHNRPSSAVIQLDPSASPGHCPDALIKKRGGVWRGDDLFGSGGAGGSVSVRARRGHTVAISVRAQNDGHTRMPLVARTALFSGKFLVAYRSDGVDVTNEVTQTSPIWIDPGASFRFTMFVTVPMTIKSGTIWSKVIRISSYYSPNTADQAVLVLHVR